MLTLKDQISDLKRQYPEARSAIMPALYLVQDLHGYITKQDISFLAEEFNLSEIEIIDLISFYSCFKLVPQGKFHLKLCRSLVCQMFGEKMLSDCLLERLKIKEGEVSLNGLWSYEFCECLGACDKGPAMLVNDELFLEMSGEKLLKFIDEIENSQH